MDESLPEVLRRIKRWKRVSRRLFRRSERVLSEGAQDILSHLDKLIEKQERKLRRRYREFFAYLAQKGWTFGDIRAALNRKVIATALIGTLAIVAPVTVTGQAPPIRGPPLLRSTIGYDPRRTVVPIPTLAQASPDEAKAALAQILPTLTHALTPGEEATLEQLLSKIVSVPVAAELEENRLNVTYGLIGAEQHLYRYPGDSLAEHASGIGNQVRVLGRGIAPGLSAWGYFATSKAALTPQALQREKWYIAAQTFLAPGWQERTNELYTWFKWRKVIVIDPTTKRAVIAVIGDAGPADWTGKKFGGSPELMDYMKLEDGAQKRGVIVLFVDDQENRLPPGPVDLGISDVHVAGNA